MNQGFRGMFGAGVAGLAAIASLLAAPAAFAAVDDVVLVSRANGAAGAAGNGDSSLPSISDDGCRVAFASAATNLTGDVVTTTQVFVRDVCAGTTTLVSRTNGPAGAIANAASTNPAISPDGHFVAFETAATNLPACNVGASVDVYLRNMDNNTTVCVSAPAGPCAVCEGRNPSVSNGGAFVTFHDDSDSEEFVPGTNDSNGSDDVFIRNVAAASTGIGSHVAGDSGTTSNGASRNASISAAGNKVAFESTGSDMAPDANGVNDVFVSTGGSVGLASTTSTGQQANGPSGAPSMARDGLAVSFSSVATNLSPGDPDGAADVFAKDVVFGSTELISRQSGQNGDKALGGTGELAMGNSRFVILGAADPALAEGVAPAPPDLYIRDRLNQTMFVASRASGALGAGANSPSIQPDFAGHGSFLVFASRATNLSTEDNDATLDIFRREISEPGLPTQGADVNVRPLQGKTLIKSKGQKRFGELLHSDKIPVGSTIAVKSGRVELTDIHQGVRESIKYYVGSFKVRQKAGGDPYLTAFLTKPRCGKKKGKGKKSARAALTSLGPLASSAARGNTLFAKGRGRFRTTGFRGSATVRGTGWITTNRCDGSTEFRVFEGGITINEKGKKKPQVMTVGRTKLRYVAKPDKKK